MTSQPHRAPTARTVGFMASCRHCGATYIDDVAGDRTAPAFVSFKRQHIASCRYTPPPKPVPPSVDFAMLTMLRELEPEFDQ